MLDEKSMMFPTFIEMLSTVFKVCFFIAFFIFNTVILNIDAHYAAFAVFGSLAGGFALEYFRPAKKWFDSLVKIILSAICALIISPAIIKYYEVLAHEYAIIIFFVVSLLALFVLRALVSLTEKNASDIIINIFTRFVSVEKIEKQNKENKDNDRKRVSRN